MTSSSPKHFLALATGQAVANVPALLHCAAPGDSVWWAWTDSAARQSAEPASRLLLNRGLKAYWFDQAMPTHPANIEAWVQRQFNRPPFNAGAGNQAQQQVVLVGNGGTKPMFQALVQALGGQLSEVVYGEGQPVAVLRMPGGMAAQASREPFAGEPLDLKNLLSCSGHRLATHAGDTGGSLLWRAGRPLPVPAMDPNFGNDRAYANAYETAVRDSESARHGFALAFEEAVASRLLAHFSQRIYWQEIVAEIWTNVKCSSARFPQDNVAEWDVLMLLRNGVAISIECKIGSRIDHSDGEKDGPKPKVGAKVKKDFDAREHMVHSSASQLAVIWVCSPMPTAYSHRHWFKPLHNLRHHPIHDRRPHLAFDFPQQPGRYWMDDEEFSVLGFEAALDELMMPYLP